MLVLVFKGFWGGGGPLNLENVVFRRMRGGGIKLLISEHLWRKYLNFQEEVVN